MTAGDADAFSLEGSMLLIGLATSELLLLIMGGGCGNNSRCGEADNDGGCEWFHVTNNVMSEMSVWKTFGESASEQIVRCMQISRVGISQLLR